MLKTGFEEHVIADIFSLLLEGGIELERDDDYLRELLLELVSSDSWLHSSPMSLADAEAQKRRFHILLLVDAGLMAEHGKLFRITNQGHDFIALTREEKAWTMTKAAVKHIGGASIQMLYRAAEGYALQKLAGAGVPIS